MNKPADNKMQRAYYSDHKKDHYCKPMVLCASDGRLIDIYGPYPASYNDACILTEVMETEKSLVEFLKPNDIIILDRGFRDCIPTLLKTYNLKAKIPT